jgi:hypothetical protein
MVNVISVRDGAAIAGRLHWWGGDLAADRLVVLIHGYQVSEDKARDRYSAFQDEIRAAGIRPRDFGAVWEFLWPGSDPRGAVSLGTYPVRVPYAINSGEMLARQWLRKRSRRQKVCLIAHSLGCRVALQAVKTIAYIEAEEAGGWDGPTVEALFLLAAAVPVGRCLPETDWYVRPFGTSGEHVFFSRRDWALRFGFGPGQGLAGENGPAVGRFGDPQHRWTTATDTNLRHKQYWTSDLVARCVGRELGLLPRSIAAESLSVTDPDDGPRMLDDRHLPERRLRGRDL